MAIQSIQIPPATATTITLSGVTTYDFYGMTIENQSDLAAATTITVVNSGAVTGMNAVYAKAFPDQWIPGTAGESPWKKVAPSSGPVVITISGAVTANCNIYYEKRT